MEGILMKPGDIKLLKIVDVTYKKQWKDQNGLIWHYHNVFVQDKQGNTARLEYYSGNETLPEDLFAKGLWQELKCIKPDLKSGAHLIEPIMDPEIVRKEERLRMAKDIANGGPGTAIPRGASEDEPLCISDIANRTNAISLQSMATSYAKDLKVAEITMRGMNAKVSDSDIEDVIRWGKMINKSLLQQGG